jgi:DNA-binding response OmpR family regulator
LKISSSVNEGKCKKLRILLVDDEPDVVEVFGRGLKLKGIQVDVYTSPQEALESFKPNTYDLAILDIRMPDMTGFQLYREMKKRDPSITTCFLSAFEMQANEFKSVFPSMDGVKAIIKKPISINELLTEITPFFETPCSC